MVDLQTQIFRWVTAQGAAVGLVFLGIGLVYALFGFRLFPFLLGVTCAGIGGVAGGLAAQAAGTSAIAGALPGALVLALCSVYRRRTGVAIASAAVWGLGGLYLAAQFGARGPVGYAVGVCAASVGVFFALTCYRTTPTILTALQGVALMILGWVGLATNLFPSVGYTFCDWAHSRMLLVPMLLVMLFVTVYSYQTMNRRGDIRTGA